MKRTHFGSLSDELRSIELRHNSFENLHIVGNHQFGRAVLQDGLTGKSHTSLQIEGRTLSS